MGAVVNNDCYVVKDGIFAGAAVLALAATASGITSYVMLRRQADEAPAKQPPLAGVAMGQPQFPPPPDSQLIYFDCFHKATFRGILKWQVDVIVSVES
ncbi:Os05g0434800 [Oryza sativa Japonica Group]|uniref:Os05g0434800 protein n=1 Tax=Oryza sativa subsp. japonica TaxID=39947 RepID=Q0DHW9_ORYSJ|nr:Os05g0434800 [Oryza sativa Japonica Group]|eukprot:NP_001055640.2 Os05g0434800 [Oryza sativa Japonica Group]